VEIEVKVKIEIHPFAHEMMPVAGALLSSDRFDIGKHGKACR